MKTNNKEKSVPLESGRRVAAYSAFFNISLTVIKAVLALISGSTALLSEAIHSLTDVLGNVTVFIGITISRKKSSHFPWGLYKVENIVAIISALFIFLVAYEIVKNTLLTEAKEIVNINTSVLVLGILIIPIYLFVRYEKKKAKQLNSPSLMADAQHWLSDILSIGVVIVGLLASRYFSYADKLAALVVIIFVLNVGYKILKNSIKSLLDASVDAETLEKIRNIVNGFTEVEEIIELTARNSGSFIFVHVDLRLSVKKLKEAHKIADFIEHQVRREVPFIERVTIHYEPAKKEHIRFAVPVEDKEGKLSIHFGQAPLIAIWDKRVYDSAVLSQDIMENAYLHLEKGKGIKLAELLIEKEIDILYMKEDFEGKGPQYVFSDAEVKVIKTDLKNVKDLMKLDSKDMTGK
jgi:cation diffusion facilitator family transporter